jgi:predicted permease
MSARHLTRLAARSLPPAWRDGVVRDIEDEYGSGTRAALTVLVIAVRLRLARGHDVIFRAHTRRSANTSPIVFRINPMRDITRDLTLAVRAAVRRPAYSLAVIATLAIGIGATTAIFSMFNWILFRPLPGAARPDELVTMRFQTAQRTANFWVAYRDYADLRDGMRTITGLAGSNPLKVDVSAGGDPERLDAEVVTTNYFAIFGVRPIAGRDFMATEEQPGNHEPAAIISRRYWRRVLNADPAALGRRVTIDGRPFTIAGVAPSGFQGRSLITVTDVWIPIGAYPTLQPQSSKDLLTSRQATFFGDAYGRLAPGATIEQAQADALAVVANTPDWARRSPQAPKRTSLAPVLTPGAGVEMFSQDRLVTMFRLLMGAVLLLLLLACANAANLLLARVTARRREIAVAHAIGASRFRIVRQQIVEGLLLSIAAGTAGIALAIGLLQLFDGMSIVLSLPAVSGVGIDIRVLTFALAASLATGLVFAVVPAIAGSRVHLQSALKDGRTTTRGGRRVLRASLVTLQVSLSIMLLIAAGLFVRTLQNIRGLDVGFQPDGLISFSVNPGRYGYTPDRSQVYFRTLLERLNATPGIERAAFTWTTSFTPNRSDTAFVVDGRAEPVAAPTTFVSPGFFETMAIPLVAGRDFTDAEVRDSNDQAGAVIVSQRVAAQLFPRGSAVGAQVPLQYPKGKIARIVGVAGDVRGRRVTADPEGFVYFPEPKPAWGTVQVRSRQPAAATVALVRDVTRSLDPVVLPADLEAFGSAIDRALGEQRLVARISTLFAGVAALLAGIGIYGMLAGVVGERRHEFGIRLALGASAQSVMRLIMRYALVVTGIGVALGVAGAALLRQVIESRLFGVTAFDPLTVTAAVASLIGLSLIAALVPGLRATRVDPVRSLRVE